MTQPTLTRSWVASANGHRDFPLQNLPLGVFSINGSAPRSGVAIGDAIFDLHAALNEFEGEARRAIEATADGQLNGFFELGRGPRVALRERLLELLAEGSPLQTREAQVLHRAVDCQMHLPAKISDYTDFYVGIEHAQNVGKLFRPDNPLLPNYKYVPIGYHGRASTIRPSGTDVRRPKGQTLPAGQTEPTFGPCARLDYELELGIWIGQGNAMGDSIAIGDAAEHIAGFCLLNDWSARDIQAWEYQPLGPFLSKSFITSISPWVVTAEALEPFRKAQPARPEGDPQPLPYLLDTRDQKAGAFDIELEVLLTTASMR
ncbi:fumarylacetoacetase, partial [Pseudomonas sp.]|uniref:fumarylacetoacetase n=1 Tax=Pseudomonas sp. TaxID=306 RepID=UPI003D7019BA